jgi:Fe-S-cluster containining protein
MKKFYKILVRFPRQEGAGRPRKTMEPVFDCRACGECCRGEGGIFLSKALARDAAGLLNQSLDEFIQAYTERRHGRLSLRVDADGWCLLHDRATHYCRIHGAKPRMCRDWPFFYGPLNHSEGFQAARGNCPGIRADATWEEFREEHRRSGADDPPRTYMYEGPWEKDG